MLETEYPAQNHGVAVPLSSTRAVNKPGFTPNNAQRKEGDGGIAAARRIPPNEPTNACPCCGAKLESQRAHVDLDVNVFLFRNNSVPLRLKEAELVHVLLQRWPGVVPHDTIIAKLWGLNEPDNAAECVRVWVCRLRKILKPLGVRILNTFDIGYRIELPEASQ